MQDEEQPLFRHEAVTAKGHQRLGAVLIHQPWGYGVAALLAALMILSVVAFGY